jgi:uncharacterized membrane protein YphA (DoxX/SURF4 family)
MNVVLWIIAGVLALAFLAAGLFKISRPGAKLKEAGLGWVDDYPAWGVKAIGALEVLGAIGLILPAALDIAPILVPIAAVGLALLMLGAVITHLRRNELAGTVPSGVLLILSAIVAWGRFGPWSF